MSDRTIQQLDITGAKHPVEIEVDHARHVLYVHVDSITVLRVCRAAFLITEHGMRPATRTEAQAINDSPVCNWKLPLGLPRPDHVLVISSEGITDGQIVGNDIHLSQE